MVQSFVLLVLILSSSVYAESNHHPILANIKPHSITIIGETHKRPESFQFFQSIINDYLQNHKCLTVALEIASNQQSTIDQVIKSSAKVSDIEVAPPIDHPDFRLMIESLVNWQRDNECFKLIAVDADIKLKTDRDAWMADRFTEIIEKTPIIALLGSIHTLKEVIWNPELTRKPPYVPEILISKGYTVQTYPQIWKNYDCNRSYRFIRADQAEATELLVNGLFSALNAEIPKTAVNIVDGIILWECD
ncbi:MAG: hypothetical protein FCKEOINB_01086 [Nitrosomonas sp.]|nr:hypothetical protein [Nitrosomonas sp.]